MSAAALRGRAGYARLDSDDGASSVIEEKREERVCTREKEKREEGRAPMGGGALSALS